MNYGNLKEKIMKKPWILLSFLILISCHKKDRYETGHFKESVINFGDINTEFDDYNSTSAYINYKYLFHFSSNRNSAGNDFDIVGENMYINWSTINGTLEIGTDSIYDRFDYLESIFDSINTSYNELGPYSIGFGDGILSSKDYWTNLIMFSDDSQGDYNIKFIYAELYNNSVTMEADIKRKHGLDFLNTEANELYPSFFGVDYYDVDEYGLDVSKITKLIYCSDSEGAFNIYELDFPSNSRLIRSLLAGTDAKPQKLSINTKFDDKCPFVNGKLLVFASNREGGYGGYDLYYSRNIDGEWSEPVNFGEDINTEYDEYRPIALRFLQFNNNVMIFSSNRPGGKGGFDLYYVGIKQMIK